MKNFLNKLEKVGCRMEAVGLEIRKESEVMDAELKDREKKGLTGAAAIQHYNEWMAANGMDDYKVKI